MQIFYIFLCPNLIFQKQHTKALQVLNDTAILEHSAAIFKIWSLLWNITKHKED